jgi:hypothetical protein
LVKSAAVEMTTLLDRNKPELPDRNKLDKDQTPRVIVPEVRTSRSLRPTNTPMRKRADLKAVRELAPPTLLREMSTPRMMVRPSSSSVVSARTPTKMASALSSNAMEILPNASTSHSRVLHSSNTLTISMQSRHSTLLTALSLMDVSSKSNSLEIDPKVIALNSNVESLPPLSSVVTLASVLTKIVSLASSNRSALLLKLELPKTRRTAPRVSATLNLKTLRTQRKLLTPSTDKTSMDVTSDSIYQPTAVAAAVEEEVDSVVVVAEETVVVVEAASVEAVTDTEVATDLLTEETEEAVAVSEEETVMATEVIDHLTVEIATEEAEAVSEEETVMAVTDVADSEAAVEAVASAEIVVEEVAIEVVEVSNKGIENYDNPSHDGDALGFGPSPNTCYTG